jgi:hypothetical protein
VAVDGEPANRIETYNAITPTEAVRRTGIASFETFLNTAADNETDNIPFESPLFYRINARLQGIMLSMVPGEGFEPPTFGLQNRCTTTVLTRRTHAPSDTGVEPS